MQLRGLPGEDLVRDGLRNLADGIESPAALLVSIGAPQRARTTTGQLRASARVRAVDGIISACLRPFKSLSKFLSLPADEN